MTYLIHINESDDQHSWFTELGQSCILNFTYVIIRIDTVWRPWPYTELNVLGLNLTYLILRNYSVWLIWLNWACLFTIAIWWPWPNIPDPQNWVYLKFVLHPKRSLYSSTYRLLESQSYSKSYLPLWSLISVIFLLSDVTLLNLCQVLPLKTKSVIYNK